MGAVLVRAPEVLQVPLHLRQGQALRAHREGGGEEWQGEQEKNETHSNCLMRRLPVIFYTNKE